MKAKIPGSWKWLILFVVLIAGCALNKVQVRDPAKTVLAEGEGLLIARLITDDSHTPFNSQSVTLRVRSTAARKDYILSNMAVPSTGGALFFGALPAGRYRIMEVVTKSKYRTLTAPLEGHVAEFDVEKDRLSDLGTLVMTMEGLLPRGGTKFRIYQIFSSQDTQAALSHLPQGVQAQVNKQPPLRRKPSADEVLAMRQFARQYAGITAQSRVVDKENVAFGRTLGIVTLWDPVSGKWTHVDTGRSLRVHSVYAEGSGPQLYGLEDGVLLANDHGRLRTINPPGKGPVIFIGRRPGGRYIAVVEERESIAVLSSPGLDPAVWSDLGRFPRHLNRSSDKYTDAQIAIARDRLIMVLWDPTDQVGVTTIHTLDFASGRWESFLSDLKSESLPWMYVSDKGTIILYTSTRKGSTLSRSDDWGRRWSSKSSDMAVAFRNESIMYGWRLGDGISMSVWKSEDGGENWQRKGKIDKVLVSKMYILPRPGWLLAATVTGDVLISKDDGASWSRHPF